MRHSQKKPSMFEDDDDQDNYTNSTLLKPHSILKAENISTRERISKYTNRDPELLLQELERRTEEEEEEED